MQKAPSRSAPVRRPTTESGPRAPLYAAIDLGTNNCRLLVATPATDGFRVVESFSRIVRLGEGLSQTGQLQPQAMDRALAALRICADKIKRRKVDKLRAVATQACRGAVNGAAFVRRVEQETGLQLSIIAPDEEARLSVAGCANLIDPTDKAALIVDVGGGSTELSWLSLEPNGPGKVRHTIEAWLSIPVGVVSLAERFPEPPNGDPHQWFAAMVADVHQRLDGFRNADRLRPLFEQGQTHLIGTSGAITSLAGVHLNLDRYDRTVVDGLWMERQSCTDAARRLIDLGHIGRMREPCIGPDRADLVLAGAAILEAVQSLWPCPRVRVADRGLREGMLLSMMRKKRRRRGKGASAETKAALPRVQEERPNGDVKPVGRRRRRRQSKGRSAPRTGATDAS